MEDIDDDGCGTRSEVLARDLTGVEFQPGGDCVVVAGALDDPYSGTTIHFHRGKGTSRKVQIDHIVPLAYAWANGAWAWSDSEREAFANDLDELLAVSGPVNASKGGEGPAEWMPPNQGSWCSYDRRFVTIVHAHHLTITAADKTAARDLLEGC